MNIFMLHPDQTTCAEYHCDKHVVKMVLETTQMLSTVHWRWDDRGPYLPVHQKHPCTLWAGESVANYNWLLQLGHALCKEYTYRYEKVHKCESLLTHPLVVAPRNLQCMEQRQRPTNPAQAMPQQYKRKNAIQAYRNYYKAEKARFCKWKNRTVPMFMRKTMSLLSQPS
jgi:hypothetical protein